MDDEIKEDNNFERIIPEYHCQHCKKPEIKIRRLTEAGKLTLTTCWICNNPECSMFINIEKVATWQRARQSGHSARDFKRQCKKRYKIRIRKNAKHFQFIDD